MMQWLVLSIALTLGISFMCSMLEAIVLSTTVADIESLKKSRPRRGQRLETIKHELDATISSILTLNTIANTLGSMVIGGLVAKLYDEMTVGIFSGVLTLVVLVFAEVLPKSLGVAYRKALQPYVVYPIWWMRRVLLPVTYVCNLVVRFFIRSTPEHHRSDEEILLLAERGAQQGTLTKSESRIIANALSLDDVRVNAIMTPRTVVTSLRRTASVADVFKEFPSLPFGRMPVYGKNIDDIVGLVRRRDLLKAKANDQDNVLVEQLMTEAHFIPETVAVAQALQVCLKVHTKILIAVDEFGATAGVLTMEDIIEHILGREIFEKDDVAVDMRELARSRQQGSNKSAAKTRSLG
jgi:CBS domain containing-hemolysin-like protein